jgi:hypothetical protein
MIARKMTRGKETFAFRQPNGRPLWVEPRRMYVRSYALANRQRPFVSPMDVWI